MRSTTTTVRLAWVLLAIVAAGVLWWVGARGTARVPSTPASTDGAKGAPAALDRDRSARLTPGSVDASSTPGATRPEAAGPRRAEDDGGDATEKTEHPEVARLQELLDDHDDAAAMVQSRRLVRSTEVPLRAAAVDALRWIATRDAARELAALTGDADADVADDAGDALLAVLDEVDDEALSATLLEQAIRSAAAPESADAFCLRLAGLDEGQSIPVLVNLIESGNERLVALGKEYLEFVTGGEEISSRAEAEAWLKEHAVKDDDPAAAAE